MTYMVTMVTQASRVYMGDRCRLLPCHRLLVKKIAISCDTLVTSYACHFGGKFPTQMTSL